jgi:FixJ family two-component response regulator
MNKRNTLLIMDDDANTRAALTRLFRRDGYKILEATNADEALSLLEDCEIGVILCEPHIKGAGNFLRLAKESFPLTQRLVLSGYTALKSVTDAINEGGVHKFFTKPWEDEVVRNEIRLAFEQYQANNKTASLYAILSSVKEEMEQRVARKLLECSHKLDDAPFSPTHADDLPVGVIVIEQEGRISFVNRKAYQILDLPDDGAELNISSLPASLNKAFTGAFECLEPLWGETESANGKNIRYSCKRGVSDSGKLVVTAVFLANT